MKVRRPVAALTALGIAGGFVLYVPVSRTTAQAQASQAAGPSSATGSFSSFLDSAKQAVGAGRKQVQETLGDKAVGRLDGQLASIDTVKSLAQTASKGGSLRDAVALAKQATIEQARMISPGFEAPLPAPSNGQLSSQALAVIMERNGVSAKDLTAEQRAKIASLDELPEAVRLALAGYLEAFLQYDATAKAAGDQLGPSLDLLKAEEFTSSLDRITERAPNVQINMARLVAARLPLLEAAASLDEALKQTPKASANSTFPAVLTGADQMDECPLSVVAPATGLGIVCIDLNSNTKNTYKINYQLQIDAGGSDTYRNNGGGNLTIAAFHTALLDLGGDDRYLGIRGGLQSGVNGGGGDGTGFLLDAGGNDTYFGGVDLPSDNRAATNGGGFFGGAGFLLDAGGGDDYRAGSAGTNGGSDFAGTGMLLDLGGDSCVDHQCDDTYEGGNKGTNGGAQSGHGFLLDTSGGDRYTGGSNGVNGGGGSGVGLLLDLKGNDVYKARGFGTNGGGGGENGAGSGFLADVEGDDTYKAGDFGGNGGGWLQGTGTLLDGSGNDDYTGGGSGVNGGGNQGAGALIDGAGHDNYVAGDQGTNGGAVTGVGMLQDHGGADSYRDTSGLDEGKDGIPSGTGMDKTVVPKGAAGAQSDQGSSLADLGITISDTPDPVPAGRNLVYKITVTNNGHNRTDPKMAVQPDTATDVVVTDELPAGVNFTSVTPSRGTCAKAGATVVCNLGDLPAGAVETVDLIVTPHNPAGAVISNTVSVSSKSDDPDGRNNSATATTTVTEGEPVLSVSIADAPPVQEGGPGTQTNARFEVSLARPSALGVTVDFVTADGAATVREGDYKSTHGTVRFDPGETTEAIEVVVRGDGENETDQDFFVNLSNPGNAIVDRGQGRGEIVDDDSPVASAGETKIKEGFTGRSDADFKVSLSQPSLSPVTLQVQTEDAMATLADGDYEPFSGTLIFEPGQTAKWVTVRVAGDTKPEPDETFNLVLTRATNARIGAKGRGVIINDDDPNNAPFEWQAPNANGKNPGRVFVTGHDADAHAGWPLSINRPGAQHIVQRALEFVTHGKSAPRLLYVNSDEFGDQSGYSGYKGMAASGFSECQSPAAPPPGCFEAASAAPLVLVQGSAALSKPLLPKRILSLETVDFGRYDAVVVASRAGGLSQPDLNTLNRRRAELVEYVRQGGGLAAFAESALDDLEPSYIVASHGPNLIGQYNFIPCLKAPCVLASNTATRDEVGFTVTPPGRALGLTDQDVNGNYSHNEFPDPAGYQIIDKEPGGRPVSLAAEGICGDRQLGGPGISINDVAQVETDGGRTVFTFTVSLECPSDVPVTVGYVTKDGTATQGEDYEPVRGVLNVPAGQTAGTIEVPVLGDRLPEMDESFLVELGVPLGAFVVKGVGEGKIVNDDRLGGENDRGPRDTAAPALRQEIPGGPFPRPNQPPAGQEPATGLARPQQLAPLPPGLAQPATQAQAQSQLQQVAQASQVQVQPVFQPQAAAAKEKEKAPVVQLARVEEKAGRPAHNPAPSKPNEYLASALQRSSPPAPALALGAVAAMLTLALSLARPKRRRVEAKIPSRKSPHRPPVRPGSPRHRRPS